MIYSKILLFSINRTIAYSVSKTRFFVGKAPFIPVIRELPITNTFSFTMIIYDAAFPSEVESVFSVSTVLDNCDFLISDVFLESFCTWKPGAEAHP